MKHGLYRRLVASTLSVAFGLAILSSPLVANAQKKPAPAAAAKTPDKKAGAAAFKKGKEAFDKKDWKAAKAQFEASTEAFPSAIADYHLAMTLEELGEFEAASKRYESAIATGKLKADSDAKTKLAALQKRPAKLKVTSDPVGAAVSVDGKVVDGKTTPLELELEPGKHKITVTAVGKKPTEQEVDVVPFAGASVTLKLELASTDPADDPFKVKTDPPKVDPPKVDPPKATPAKPSGKSDHTWAYVTGGVAVAALGVGALFGVMALGNQSDFDKTPSTDLRDKGTRNALIADMGFGIGATLAVTSLVLFLTSGEDVKDSPKASLSKPVLRFAPIVGMPTRGTPTTLGAAASLSF